MTADNFKFDQSSCPKVRLPLFHRDWEKWALSFLMITFQRDGLWNLEKDIPGL